MRLLCDEMLHGLGRWLRAAGYDTAIVAGALTDGAVIEAALAQERLLLTCDRDLGARRELEGRVVVLPPAGLDAAAGALGSRLRLDWLRAPFTRCLLDNTPLVPASASDLARVPGPARDGEGPFRACPTCERVYWPGSHVRRMAAPLARWNGGAAGEATFGGRAFIGSISLRGWRQGQEPDDRQLLRVSGP
jgi:uncharacterized protein